MKYQFQLILFVQLLCSVLTVFSQSETQFVASTNINKSQCPCIMPDNSVVFQLKAPGAQKLQIDLGKLYDMEKGDDGVWSVRTEALDPGFHYYSLVINGISVCDPASKTFYGMGRMASAIEIPEKGVDFYTLKDVLHGTLCSKYYYS